MMAVFLACCWDLACCFVRFATAAVISTAINRICPTNPRFKLNKKIKLKKYMFINLFGFSYIFLGVYKKIKGQHKKIQGGAPPPFPPSLPHHPRPPAPLYFLMFSFDFLIFS